MVWLRLMASCPQVFGERLDEAGGTISRLALAPSGWRLSSWSGGSFLRVTCSWLPPEHVIWVGKQEDAPRQKLQFITCSRYFRHGSLLFCWSHRPVLAQRGPHKAVMTRRQRPLRTMLEKLPQPLCIFVNTGLRYKIHFLMWIMWKMFNKHCSMASHTVCHWTEAYVSWQKPI